MRESYGYLRRKIAAMVQAATGGECGGPAVGPEGLNELHALSRRGLWAILTFLAASAVAYLFRTETLSACLSPSMRELLGEVPPGMLFDILLAVSTVSSLIIIAGRIGSGARPGRTAPHLWFRLAFYLLYFIADSLGSHFDAVFVSGLLVLAVQHYHVWNYATRAIEEKLTVRRQVTQCGR